MKDLSSLTAEEAYLQKYRATQGNSFSRVSFVDDNGLEQPMDDIKYPYTIKKFSKPKIYANTNYTPSAARTNFEIINDNGDYSPKNTASDKNGILVQDRVFKFYQGYYLPTQPTAQTKIFDLSVSTDIETYFMRQTTDSTGSFIEVDATNSEGNSDPYFNFKISSCSTWSVIGICIYFRF